MTTIIAMNTADDRAIYCDSLVQHGSIVATGYRKYFVVPGILVGGSCGSQTGVTGVVTALKDIIASGDICTFFEHPGRVEPRKMSDFDQREFEMLLLYDRVLYLMYEDMTPIPVLLPYIAKGSGGPFALGALAAGVTPWLALAIASKYDIGTGGHFFRCDMEGKIARRPPLLVE